MEISQGELHLNWQFGYGIILYCVGNKEILGFWENLYRGNYCSGGGDLYHPYTVVVLGGEFACFPAIVGAQIETRDVIPVVHALYFVYTLIKTSSQSQHVNEPNDFNTCT